MSQKRRKMIECIFGWGKQHGTMRKASTAALPVSPALLLNLIAYCHVIDTRGRHKQIYRNHQP
jgi:hypothetical protein